MKNVNQKSLIYAFVFITIVVWLTIAVFKGIKFPLTLSDWKDLLFQIPTIVTIDMIVFWFFAKWGWKCSVFRGWLVTAPDLNGTWIGEVDSNWIDSETREKIPKIPAMLKIKQSLFNISCVMRTKEMTSRSFAEALLVDDDRQVKSLVYIYTSKPEINLKDRSVTHDGSANVEILEKSKKLEGHYWNSRDTYGTMKFDFHSKELLEQFPENFGKHPKENSA